MSKREDLEIVIGADLGGLAADLKKGAGLVKNFQTDIARGAANSGNLISGKIDTSGLREAARHSKEMGSGFREAASSMAGFAGKVAFAAGGLVALELGFKGVSGAMELVKDSVRMAADVEQNTIAFETMLGSIEKTKEVMGDLRKFAADTPFSNKEVTDSARQLIAYGVAVDELIPTLKLVGTLSAGVSKPLSETVYKYGTTKTQGVAHQIDINQLTNAGFEVIPFLAKQLKIETSQVRKYTEEGRVDFETYKAALIDLGNTKFAGLLEKQAGSLKGTWEQMTDAFDRAKLKLGQIIVEEVGLKRVGKDLESFADRVEKSLDGPALREGIRFVGDLAKAAAQVSYEFGRAGVSIASLNIEGLTRTAPGVAQLAANIKEFVAGLQDFKIDKRLVATMGVNLFKSIAVPLAEAADFVNVEGKAYADAFQKNFIDPAKELVEIFRVLHKVWKLPDDLMDSVRKAGMKPEVNDAGKQAVDNAAYLRAQGLRVPMGGGAESDIHAANAAANLVKASKDLAFFNPPRADEPLDHVKFRYAHLNAMIQKGEWIAEQAGWKMYQPHLDALRKQRGEFLMPFSSDPGGNFGALDAQFKAGQIPARRADWIDIAPPAVKGAPKSHRQALEERIENYGSSVFDGLARDAIKDGFTKMYDGIDTHAANAKMFTDQMRLTVGLGPMSALAPALPMVVNRPDLGAGIKRETGVPSHIMELANRLNDEFDPTREGGRLMRVKEDMERALKAGLIKPSTFDMGWNKEVRDAAEKLHIGGPPKLADATLVGSQEDARLLSNFMSGNQQKTTDDILRAIDQKMQMLLESSRTMERAKQPQTMGWFADF